MHKRLLCVILSLLLLASLFAGCEEDATITHVAQLLNHSLYYPEDIARYKDLCDDVYLTTSDSKIAETAQILYNHIQPL